MRFERDSTSRKEATFFILPFTEKTTAAAAAADAGVVFYQIGATGINAGEHYQEQARAASKFSAGIFIGGAGKSVI